MFHQIRELQHTIGMSDAELLRLAREVAQNGALVSLRDLSSAERLQLRALLSALWAEGLEPEHFKTRTA